MPNLTENSVTRYSALLVGQKVYSGLYGGRYGYIYRIHGEQEPSTVESLASGIMSGGNAEFDVIFENGTFSQRIAECIIHCCQWQHFDEIATPVTLEKLMQFHFDETARKKAEKEDEERIFKKVVSSIRANSNFAHLVQGDDPCSGKLAAVNIRKELKRAFNGVKFSVQNNSFGSIRVRWNSNAGPEIRDVERFLRHYQVKNFNRLENSYETMTRPWHAVFGGVNNILCLDTL